MKLKVSTVPSSHPRPKQKSSSKKSTCKILPGSLGSVANPDLQARQSDKSKVESSPLSQVSCSNSHPTFRKVLSYLRVTWGRLSELHRLIFYWKLQTTLSNLVYIWGSIGLYRELLNSLDHPSQVKAAITYGFSIYPKIGRQSEVILGL
jgi:hypothetical protein